MMEMVRGGGRRRCGGVAMAAPAIAELLLLLFLFLAPFLSLANANTYQDDVTALNVLYGTLKSATQLTNWMSENGDPCEQNWLGVVCSASRVTAIKLSGMGLNGQLGYNMNLLTSLVELDLSSNNLGGSSIPYNLPANLQRLNLASNQFTGDVPYSISYMSSLQYLNLAHNQLTSLQDMFGHLGNLTFLDLSYNAISGNLPQSFSDLTELKTLYLQNNQFTGTINVLANLSLTDLNVANNQLTGWIPDQLKNINDLQTGGNSFSDGPAPPPPPSSTPPVPASQDSPSSTSPTKDSPKSSNPTSTPGSGKTPPDSDHGNDSINGHKKTSGISIGGIVGIVVSVAVAGGLVAFFLIGKKRRVIINRNSPEPDVPFAPLSEANNELNSIRISRDLDFEQKATAVGLNSTFSLKPPPKIDLHRSFDENDQSSKSLGRKISISSVKAEAYTVADLQVATDSFSHVNLVGEGSFGRVYRARFNDGKVLAVKKINFSAFRSHPSESFVELLTEVSRLHHPNLTEFVGYCAEHGQCLLVYEFYRNGSLQGFLHLSEEYGNILSWNNRVKIALGSAKALEYLHEVCSPSVVHKNFKSANILLGTDFNPHISDTGFASLTANPDFRSSPENLGYEAPEISQSGQYSMKSDVYSFGVVMLELVTGRMAFDSSRPRAEQSLVRWATPQLHDIDALDRMVDPALNGHYPAKSLSRLADVIALCVQPEPEFRPPMSEVVQALLRLVQRANMNQRGGAGPDGQRTPRRMDDIDDAAY